MSLDELVAKYGAREETVIKEEPLSDVEGMLNYKLASFRVIGKVKDNVTS